jgi:NAD kinase
MNIEFAIIVKNKTRLETLIERFNTTAQAKFYIERSGGDFEDYEIEHQNFHRSLELVQRQLSKVVKNKIVERNFLPAFLFNDKQVVIVVGQDGLVANTAKYVNEIPIVAVNPDSERYDGVLLPFSPDNFIDAVEKVITNKYSTKIATLAEVKLNDGQRLLAFNDLFIGASSHVSARYRITYKHKTEEHSSSGIIVSTKAGSTGWLSSIFNMTFAMRQFIEKDDGEKKAAKLKDDQLMFAVREPFQSKTTQTELVAGLLTGQTTLVLESLMPTNGVIFSDGIEADFLNFNSGSIATIGTAKERAKLVCVTRQ